MEKGQKGFAHIVILFVLTLALLGGFTFFVIKNRYIKLPPSFPNDPTVEEIEGSINKETKIYTNKPHNFTLELPGSFELPPEDVDDGYLGEYIYFSVSQNNPLDCQGPCPINETIEEDVQIGELLATKTEGFIGEIGGGIAQRFISYIFTEDKTYYVFTQYALSKNTDTDSSTPPVSEILRIEFDEIMSTFQFSEEPIKPGNINQTVSVDKCRITLSIPDGWNVEVKGSPDLGPGKGCLQIKAPDFVPILANSPGLIIAIDKTPLGSTFKNVTIYDALGYANATRKIIESETPIDIVSNFRDMIVGNMTGEYFEVSTMTENSYFAYSEKGNLYTFRWPRDYVGKYNDQINPIIESLVIHQ